MNFVLTFLHKIPGPCYQENVIEHPIECFYGELICHSSYLSSLNICHLFLTLSVLLKQKEKYLFQVDDNVNFIEFFTT